MKNLIFTTVLLLCYSIIASGQSYNSTTGVLTIDLAQSQQKLKIKVVPKKNLTIKIENLLPFTKYTLITELVNDTIPPIDLGAFTLDTKHGIIQDTLLGDPCTEKQNALIYKIYNSTTEKALDENWRELLKTIEECGGINQIKDESVKAQLLLIPGITQKEYPLNHFHPDGKDFLIVGEKLTLKIIREDDPNQSIEKKEFGTFEISPGSKGTWETNYGFSFNATSFGKNKEYYSKADTGGTYLITEKRSKIGLGNVYPTVFLTYYPQKKYLSPVFVGFTSGLGSNFDDISVFVAPSLVIEQNVLISAGISLTKSLALKGEYDVNQRIKENLNSDQLHSNTYRPNLFFSISYRFNKNPFKKASEE